MRWGEWTLRDKYDFLMRGGLVGSEKSVSVCVLVVPEDKSEHD